MNQKESLSYKTGRKIDVRKLFLISAHILIYCPFLYSSMIGNYVGDTAIQTRIGLDCINNARFMPIEIYSWHEGLNWWPHEFSWYYILAIAYKLFGLIGIIGVAAAFNYAIAAIAFRKYQDKVHPLIIVGVAAAARLLSFPNYNARPHLFSELAFLLVIYVMLSNKSIWFKSAFFCGAAFLLAWFHGGMIPRLFVT